MICFVLQSVMLSNYLRNNRAHFNAQLQHISLSFAEEEIAIDILPSQYQHIKVLSLTHCRLTTLQGIEQFQQLEELNIRSNCITEVDELMRIANKQLIERLEFTGNDIEYLGGALFINLRPHFPNLIELNGKNYHAIIHKHSHKRHQMKNILAHAHQIRKDMLKTLRKEDRRTKTLSRMTEEAMRTEHCYNTHPEEDETERAASKSREALHTSKHHRSRQSPSPSPSRPSPSPHRQDEEKENLNNSNHLEYDLSLTDISNIPMTKSVRGSFLPNDLKLQKRNKGLEILTLNDSHNNNQGRLPLSQPTATFAMQREKQAHEGGLMFRNKEKTQKYTLSPVLIQQGCKDDYERPTKRETYQSVSEEMNESWSSSYCDNIIHEDKTSNEMKKIQLAGVLFTKNLMEKVFYSWRTLPPEKNFPVKRHFM